MKILFHFFVAAFICLPSFADEDIFSEIVSSFKAGEPAKAGNLCAKIIFNKEKTPAYRYKSAVLLGLSLYLQDNPGAVSRCGDMLSVLRDDPDFAGSPIVPFLEYLSLKIDDAKLDKACVSFTPDWGALAKLCQYVVNAKQETSPKKLYGILVAYSTAMKALPANNWASAWGLRIFEWQKWANAQPIDSKSMEPLFAKSKVPEEGPSVFLKKIITAYLNKEIEVAFSIAVKAKTHFSSKKPKQPVVKAFEMLSGDKPILQEELFKVAGNERELWALTSLAVFLRDIVVIPKNKWQANDMLSYLSNFTINTAQSKDLEIQKWQKKAQLWKKWCEDGYKYLDGLEPLFKEPEKTPEQKAAIKAAAERDVMTIDLDEFTEERRDLFKGRPKPRSLDYDREKMKSYILSLSDKKLQKAELSRYNYIKDIKDYLIHFFHRNSYTGKVKLRFGTMTGTIYMANVNVIMIRKKGRKKSKSYAWKDFDVTQYITLLKFYAKQRLSKAAPGVTEDERKKHAAEDYLRLAVFCDWFGKYQKSLKYAKKALLTCPELKKDADYLFFGPAN